MARRFGGTCARITSIRRWNFASATSRPKWKKPSPLPRCFKPLPPSCINSIARIWDSGSTAARYGLDGKLIDFGKRQEVNTRALIVELLEFVDDVVDELGSREEISYVYT